MTYEIHRWISAGKTDFQKLDLRKVQQLTGPDAEVVLQKLARPSAVNVDGPVGADGGTALKGVDLFSGTEGSDSEFRPTSSKVSGVSDLKHCGFLTPASHPGPRWISSARSSEPIPWPALGNPQANGGMAALCTLRAPSS